MRCLVERNTMRYYVAIEAFPGAVSSPPRAQIEKRLRDWVAATENFPRQVHEVDESACLEMTRRESRRQQKAVAAPARTLAVAIGTDEGRSLTRLWFRRGATLESC